MSLSEDQKTELLNLASGHVPVQERQRLEQLIQSDAECRRYWNSLTSTIHKLEVNATSYRNTLPPQFHAKLTGRLRRATHTDTAGLARFRPSIPKLALLALLLFAIALTTRFNPHPSPPIAKNDSPSMPVKTHAIAKVSWAALRQENPSALPSHAPEAPNTQPSRPLSMAWSDRADWIQEFDL